MHKGFYLCIISLGVKGYVPFDKSNFLVSLELSFLFEVYHHMRNLLASYVYY